MSDPTAAVPASRALPDLLDDLTSTATKFVEDDGLPTVAGAVVGFCNHRIAELSQMGEDAKQAGFSPKFRQSMTVPLYLSLVKPRVRRPHATQRCQGRSRQARPGSTRTRGSRRATSQSAGGGSSGSDPDLADPDGAALAGVAP